MITQKLKLEDVKNGLLNNLESEAKMYAEKLSLQAKDANMALDVFLDYSIDKTEGKASELAEKDLSGFEMVSLELGIPFRESRHGQIQLAQASDTFATKPGTRIMFPYTVDNVVRWNTRQDNIQSISDMVASSRTITGNELIRQVAEEATADSNKSFVIAEGTRIPVRKVKSTTRAVEIFKHGSGLEFTYEFNRRNMVELITPYGARVARQLELDKMGSATKIMIEGDGVNPAATTLSQKTLDPSSTDGTLSYNGIIQAVAAAAKKGVFIDTIAGDIDAYMQYIELFGTAAVSSSFEADQKAEKGAPRFLQVRNLFAPINFVLNTHVPAGKLLMFSKADTMEEIVEAGSRIEEEERAIRTQVITYVKTENSGYGLIYGDTRFVYTYKV